jgi:hypothetical protein
LKWIKQVQTIQLNNYAKGVQTSLRLKAILPEKLAQRRPSEIEQYLAKYFDGFRSLNVAALAADLVQKLENKSALVDNIIKNLSTHNRDDVSLEILKKALGETLKDVVQTESDRDVVLRLVRELDSSPTFREEVSMMQKGMRAVTSVKTGKPPTIQLPSNQTASFIGQAHDVEDGELTGDNLVWESDRDGVLGRGNKINLVLSSPSTACPGTIDHTITLTATDSDGNSASSKILITIGAIC